MNNYDEIDVNLPLREQPDWYIADVVKNRDLYEKESDGEYYSAQNEPIWPNDSYRPRQDSIDWSHLHPDFKYIRRDRNESVGAYSHEPKLNLEFGLWGHELGRKFIRIDGLFTSYKRGNMPLDKMILDRPAEE